jgi:sulfite exporter TauE/SafE
VAGLKLLGVSRGRPASSALFWSFFSRLLSPLLSARPRGFALVVGLLMGFLPCPLVYAALGAAAASAHAAGGALILAGTALGTIPALLAVAAFGAAVPVAWRHGLARAAGALLLAVALVTLGRGLAPGLLHAGHHRSNHGSSTGSAGSPACDHGP